MVWTICIFLHRIFVPAVTFSPSLVSVKLAFGGKLFGLKGENSVLTFNHRGIIPPILSGGEISVFF